MRGLRLTALGVLACHLGVSPASAQPPTLRSLFPHQAELRLEEPGAEEPTLVRLELPAAVLAECRPDLSDLRLFDLDGGEIPFLVDAGRRPEVELALMTRSVPPIREVSQRQMGEEEPILWSESYTLGVPDGMGEGEWDLVMTVKAQSFVRRVDVVATDASGRRTALVGGSSVFRLQGPLREKLRLFLGRLPWSALEVTLEGEGGFLEPVLAFETSRTLGSAGLATVPLAERSRQDGEGRTVVQLLRPVGLRPSLLRMATSTAAFNRRVEVWDEGPGASASGLGAKTLFRAPGLSVAEDLELSLGAMSGDRLRVVIANGDSPPLEELVFEAVVRRPALIFPIGRRGGGAAAVLRFGGGRAFAPDYDLEGLMPPLGALNEEAVQGAELLGDRALPKVRFGEVEANPYYNREPALAFAMRPGAEIDVRRYRFRRRLDARPSAEGLVRYRLSVEDLGVAQADLRDLRVVDAEERQWAYLLSYGAEEERVLELVDHEVEDGRSTYELVLPGSTAAVSEVSLITPVPYFDRDYVLVGVSGEVERTLAEGRIARRVGDPRPVRIEVPAPRRRLGSLRLIVVDGNDAPLVVDRFSARFPVSDVFFAAPAGPYELLLGSAEARAPSYELERVRAVVLAVESGEAVAGPLEESARFSAAAGWTRGGRLQRLAVWVVLGVAALFLAWITVRLVREEGRGSG